MPLRNKAVLMEQRYCDSSDEELIKLLRNGDEEIYDFLCSKYKG